MYACDGDPTASEPQAGKQAGQETGGQAGLTINDMGGLQNGGDEIGGMAGIAIGGMAGNEPPSDDPLCDPCSLGDSGSCPEGFFCHQLPPKEDGTQEEPFCTRSCTTRACPGEFECRSVDDEAAEAGMAGGGEVHEDQFCLPIANSCSPVFCNDQDGDGYGRGRDCLGLDCDDENPEVHPGVTQDLCDGIDNNCNGSVDEGFESTSCGQGTCSGRTVCLAGVESCEASGATGTDENCDGMDDDCDGQTDEGYQMQSCGFGTCQALSVCAAGMEMCEPSTPVAGDTDQTCDLIDSDCDGFVDEGYTGETCGVGMCEVRARCTETGIECTPLQAVGNDSNCNQLDDDCDGSVDEGYMGTLSCGIGACRRVEQCGTEGIICTAGNPISVNDDTCDGIDDNCNGLIDEGCASNTLSFELVLNEADAITVAILLSRGEEVGEPNLQTLPTRLDLHMAMPQGLSLAAGGITLGSGLISQEISETLSDRNPNPQVIRLFFPFNTPNSFQAVLPGELVRLRFDKLDGATGPFSFEWIEGEPYTDLNGNGVCESNSGEPYTDLNNNGVCDENTTISPEAALAIMTLSNASLGGL